MEDLFDGQDYTRYDLDDECLSNPKTVTVKDPDSLSDLSARRIESLEDLKLLESDLAAFRGLRGYDFLYRGQSRSDYELFSTIVRHECSLSEELDVMKEVEACCVSERIDSFRLEGFDKDLFYAGIARHCGVWNRLLDWTACFRIALSFLAEENSDRTGSLWILAMERASFRMSKGSPYEIEDDRIHVFKEDYYLPDGCTLTDMPVGIFRRYRQNGFFTATSAGNAARPLNEVAASCPGIECLKIDISPEMKAIFRSSDYMVSKDDRCLGDNDEMVKSLESLNSRYTKAM